MALCEWPTTTELRETFAHAIAQAGGKLTDAFDDEGVRLYIRGVLPEIRQVASGDGIQGGVAMRATDCDVRVHPYTYRQVCRNGAIRAEAIQTVVIQREEFLASPDVLELVHDAVRDCCAPAAFAESTRQMRSAKERNADMMLMILPMLRHLPPQQAASLLAMIERQTHREERSAFGVMQAVTATARDQRDPELRWRLEELGGAIGALLRPRRSLGPTAATPTRQRVLVEA